MKQQNDEKLKDNEHF